MKILILKVQTIGDTLLITPLVNNLFHHFEQPKIDVVVNQGTSDMLTFNPNINKIIAYTRETFRNTTKLQRIRGEYKFIKIIRSKKYDMVIDLDQGDRGAAIAMLSGAKTKIGSKGIKSKLVKNTYTHFLPKRLARHTVEINLDPLRILNIPITSKKVEIYWSEKDEQVVKDRLSTINNFIHIHPFSKGWFRELDSQITAKIIDYCEQKLNIKIIITAAPIKRELEKIDEILRLCQSDPINFSGKLNLNLKQTAALNKRARLFIGVDTAIPHISAANNTPALVFFGPTAPDTWGPWDNDLEQANYNRGGGVQINGKHRVISDIKHCMPCNNEGCDNSQISNCLMELDINIIKKNIKEMLA
jgi:heptosyltransferase III